MINLATLKTEIALPAYNGLSDAQVAEALNAVSASHRVDRDTIPAYEAWEAIVPGEWAALNATERTRIQTILSMGTIKVKGTNTRSAFLASFAAGTATRTNLAALQTRDGSRAEVLFAAGDVVTPSHVADARRLP